MHKSVASADSRSTGNPCFSDIAVLPLGESANYVQRMHPEPRRYKYRWWVFCRDSACDGRSILDDRSSMSTAEAMALLKEFSARREFPDLQHLPAKR